MPSSRPRRSSRSRSCRRRLCQCRKLVRHRRKSSSPCSSRWCTCRPRNTAGPSFRTLRRCCSSSRTRTRPSCIGCHSKVVRGRRTCRTSRPGRSRHCCMHCRFRRIGCRRSSRRCCKRDPCSKADPGHRTPGTSCPSRRTSRRSSVRCTCCPHSKADRGRRMPGTSRRCRPVRPPDTCRPGNRVGPRRRMLGRYPRHTRRPDTRRRCNTADP